jgi:hypothetical protein
LESQSIRHDNGLSISHESIFSPWIEIAEHQIDDSQLPFGFVLQRLLDGRFDFARLDITRQLRVRKSNRDGDKKPQR